MNALKGWRIIWAQSEVGSKGFKASLCLCYLDNYILRQEPVWLGPQQAAPGRRCDAAKMK